MKSSVKESVHHFFAEVFSNFFWTMILLMSVLFLMYGMVLGLGHILGDRLWLGFIVTGICGLIGKLIYSKFFLPKKIKNSLNLKNLSEIDLIKWTEKYPFYSTGLAAISGFIMAGGISLSTFESVFNQITNEVLKETMSNFSNEN